MLITDAAEPAWSPDGEQIAFTRYDDVEARQALWLASPEGGDERRVGPAASAPDWERVNRPPQARFTWTPDAPGAGEVVAFRSRSGEPDGPLAAQDWDLDGDGRFGDGFGKRASWTFSRSGTFVVRLRVRDLMGRPTSTREQ